MREDFSIAVEHGARRSVGLQLPRTADGDYRPNATFTSAVCSPRSCRSFWPSPAPRRSIVQIPTTALRSCVDQGFDNARFTTSAPNPSTSRATAPDAQSNV